jgi:2-keto-4-pentenoate hydratase/2-oxohepta-3-ene-1,7-dioic acid hydratase in catechol pathway
MKLVRYGERGREKPGLVDSAGAIRDLSGVVEDITPATLSTDSLLRLQAVDPNGLPRVSGSPRLGAPIAGIRQIIAVGLNYSDHAAESGMPVPSEPILFSKAITSISGPNDPVIIPRGSTKTDWEVELAIVIGHVARRVSVHDALDYVAGYTVCNDVSEREYQLERLGQWMKGKSCDSFCPLGPWLVTRDEIPDPQVLEMGLEVNGRVMQKGSTRTMIFPVAHLVSYISHFMTLLPGDVIPTGTPPGVGMGMKPQTFLKAGDTMRLWIEGLGEQQQTCVAWEDSPEGQAEPVFR